MSKRHSKQVARSDFRSIIFFSLVCLFCVLLPLSPRSQSLPPAPTVLPGQSATVLSDGKWLLAGGEANKGSLSTISIWDAHSGVTSQLPSQLQYARAYHTTTMLPD